MDAPTGTPAIEPVREPAEARTRVRLCGELELELPPRGVVQDLRGRQARLVVAYLVTHRGRAVSRGELIELLWPERAPKDPQADLRPVLSGVRRALGADVLEGRDPLRLVLREPVSVDTERAVAAVDAARAAARQGDWPVAREHALVALDLLASRFLSGDEADWIDRRRREFEELQLEALEWTARGAFAVGDTELGAARQAARELIARAPFRESGHRFLMESLAAEGNVAEALRVYDDLRVRLRDELGTAPASELQALHQRLLSNDPPARTAPGGSQPALPSVLRRSAERGAFVGREAQLARLEELWEATIQGHPEPVMVVGEPGIGKTRLAAHFAAGIHSARATVLYGRCDEDALGAYQPFVEALGQWASDLAPDVLSTYGVAAGAELAALVPELGRALGDLPTSPRADPELERYRLLDGVRELIWAIAADAPVLIVLDDLHWADQGTLRMLRYVLRASSPGPIMVLGTHRDADLQSGHPLVAMLDDLRREHVHVRLELGGLDEREVAALVESQPGQPPGDDVVRTIHDETAGNPFFIEAVVQHLAERGAQHRGSRCKQHPPNGTIYRCCSVGPIG